MPIPPRSSQQLPGEGKLPPQPATVLDALETITIDVFSELPNLPPPFAREAANGVNVENLVTLPFPSPPRSPPPLEQEVDLEEILVHCGFSRKWRRQIKMLRKDINAFRFKSLKNCRRLRRQLTLSRKLLR
jgi:hypothetical protein